MPGGREPSALGQLVQGRRACGGGAPAAPPAALPAAGRPAARRRAHRRRRGQLHLRRPQRVRVHQEDLPRRGPRIPGMEEAIHLALKLLIHPNPRFLQGDPEGLGLGYVDLDFVSSLGWWAATIATYCPISMMEHLISNSTQPRFETFWVTL